MLSAIKNNRAPAFSCDTKLPNNLPVSLTLTCFPPPETPHAKPNIARLLEQLLPLVSHIPLTLDLLNAKSMSPYSEASHEDLHAGRLQLPSGSVVIFDERIEEGKLGERGESTIAIALRCIDHCRIFHRSGEREGYSRRLDETIAGLSISIQLLRLQDQHHLNHTNRRKARSTFCKGQLVPLSVIHYSYT